MLDQARSTSGIGQATAARLAVEGARLVLAAHGRDRLESAAEELRRQYEAHLLAVVADVSTVEGTNAFVESALGHFGRIDGLVSNAGSSAAKSLRTGDGRGVAGGPGSQAVCRDPVVADLIAFLLSDRAAYISGTAINFDVGAAAVP